jgi:hypothetical protein
MKRIASAGALFLLAVMVGAPLAQAETPKPTTAGKAVSLPELSAFDLASLAYRGAFRDQGIPGYAILTEAHRAGRIRAKDLVNAAIKTNRLSNQALTDQRYINAIDANLRALNPNR